MHIKLLLFSTLVIVFVLITYTEAYRNHRKNRLNRNQTRNYDNGNNTDSHKINGNSHNIGGRRSHTENFNNSERRPRLHNSERNERNSTTNGHNAVAIKSNTSMGNQKNHTSNNYSKEIIYNSSVTNSQSINDPDISLPLSDNKPAVNKPVYIVYNQPQNPQFSIKENFSEGLSEGLNLAKRINEMIKTEIADTATTTLQSQSPSISSNPLENVNIIVINTLTVQTQAPETIVNNETVSPTITSPCPDTLQATKNNQSMKSDEIINNEVVSSTTTESENDLTANSEVMSPITLTSTLSSREIMENFYIVLIYII